MSTHVFSLQSINFRVVVLLQKLLQDLSDKQYNEAMAVASLLPIVDMDYKYEVWCVV